MKKTLRYIVVAALALVLTQAAALAAAPVAVQLDGQAVTFTDAAPQIVNDRTFLPVRAVFEAMGAEVGYDNATRTVTAKRDGRVVTMTIDSKEASVTENGKTTPITMDVAPYIDPALSRTYVPVRFAAQALGANVGWDADTRTVLIEDTEKIVGKLMDGKTFNNLDKLAAFSNKYSEGTWTSTVDMSGTVTVDLAQFDPETPIKLSVPMTVSAKGVTADATKMDITETIKMDLSSVLTLVKSMSGDDAPSAEDLAMIEALAQAMNAKGLTVNVRGDMAVGKLYVNIDVSALGDLAAEMGVDSKTWFVLDMKSAYDEMGMDYAGLIGSAKSFDFKQIVSGALASDSMDDAAVNAQINATVKALVDAFADSSFTKSGDTLSTTFAQEIEGITLKCVIAMTMKNDAVTAYGYEIGANGDAAGMGTLNLAMKLSVDEKDKVAGSLTMNVLDAVKADFTISGGYTKGGSAPAVEPPAGATVQDLMNMMGAVDF
ncbi:MAG: copper amine oxidase N-terminal domain-containing protein [Ruminococcaceae bacterium]|nr:copper amine oxidase N-terminal domain-containing protein [Oscillospiraceae bacterium]